MAGKILKTDQPITMSFKAFQKELEGLGIAYGQNTQNLMRNARRAAKRRGLPVTRIRFGIEALSGQLFYYFTRHGRKTQDESYALMIPLSELEKEVAKGIYSRQEVKKVIRNAKRAAVRWGVPDSDILFGTCHDEFGWFYNLPSKKRK